MPHPELVLPFPYPIVLRYCSFSRNEVLRVLHEVEIEEGHFVKVIGVDETGGAYEWLIQTPHQIKHSDAGYSQAAVALRDALVIYFRNDPVVNRDICCRDAIRTIDHAALAEGGQKRWRYRR